MSLIEKAVEKYARSVPESLRRNVDVPQILSINKPNDHLLAAALRQPPRTLNRNRVQLDLKALQAGGYLYPADNNPTLADELRVIKRPLLQNTGTKHQPNRKHANLIGVTSAQYGEGKSFTAINLALSIALERDRHVLLVDADVTRPSLPRLLGCAPRQGLLDVLAGDEVGLKDVLVATDIDKLSLLTTGTAQLLATELLASIAMHDLLDELARRYPDRIVIFDLPAVLTTTESRVLVNLMGQLVFVVSAAQTLQSAIKEALGVVAACPLSFLVLNRTRSD